MSSLLTVSMVTATAFRSSSMGCSAETVFPGICRADVNGDISGRPALQIGRRDADLPAAVGVDHGGILDAVDGDGDVRARCRWVLEPVTVRSCCCSMALITSSPEMVFTRRRKLGVDVDITLAAAGVAVGVGDRSGKVNAPSPKAFRSADEMVTLGQIAACSGVALTAHRNRDRVARRRAGDAPAQGLIHRHFSIVDRLSPAKVLIITCGSWYPPAASLRRSLLPAASVPLTLTVYRVFASSERQTPAPELTRCRY